MAPKGEICLRCPKLEPGQLEIYKHGDNLAKCQKQIKADGKPYSLRDLWPLFDGNQSAEHHTQNEAREFFEQATQSARNGVNQPWTKKTMEEAAKLGYPESEANKKKQKPKLASVMSSLSIAASTPGSTPGGAVPSTKTTAGTPQPASVSSVNAPQSWTSATAAPGAIQTPVAQPPTGAAPTVLAPAMAAAPTAARTSVAVGPLALADAKGPHFMTQQVQRTNQAAVHQYIQGLAGRLADSEHENQQRLSGVPMSSRNQLTSQQRDGMKPSMIQKYGLRTGFAAPDPGALIETNFLSMTFPPRIYVYDVEMIRGLDANGNPIPGERQWDQLEILHTITFAQPQFPRYTAVLHTNHASWVSDGSLIWSTVALFNSGQPRQVPGPLVSTPAHVIGYENEIGHPLTIDRLNITFRQEFDLTRSVGELFFGTTATTFRDSGPSILTSGLNAFFTRYVRDRSDPIVPGNTSSYVRVGLNRSFRTDGSARTTELDETNMATQTIQAVSGFSLSVRPGTNAMNVNINNSTSPFFKSITVQEFIERCTAFTQGRSIQEVVSALKGAKVRITYHTNQTQNSFPRSNSRCRFITTIVDHAHQALITEATIYPLVQNACQWYAHNSPYRGNPEYPSPVVQQNSQYFVNEGKDLARNPPRACDVEWYPARALQIVGFQPFTGRLVGSQTAEMITAALKAPLNHWHDILNTQIGGGLHHFAFDGSPACTHQGGLRSINMSVGTQFTQVSGRWLLPPNLLYWRGALVPPTGASWDLRQSRFATPGTVREIPVLNLSGPGLPQAFEGNLIAQLRLHGLVTHQNVSVKTKDLPINRPELTSEWEQALFDGQVDVLSVNIISSFVRPHRSITCRQVSVYPRPVFTPKLFWREQVMLAAILRFAMLRSVTINGLLTLWRKQVVLDREE